MIILFYTVSSCAVPLPENEEQLTNRKNNGTLGQFALPQQKAPPKDIQSIQLYAKDNPANPPVIKLNSMEKLILSFDYLSEQNQQFRVEISHRSQTWEESNISRSVYHDSFFKTYVQNSKESLSQRPSYQHVEFEFPNSQLKPAVSGNYLLMVYTYDGNELLFSIPFFITENQGKLETRIERLFTQRKVKRAMDQLFSSYQYPAFVDFPQFDLSMSYVQNEFWGRMRQVENLDTTTPGELNGHLTRDAAYVSDYSFKSLDLRTFDVDGRQVIEYQPQFIPPRITLRRDIQNLNANTSYFSKSLDPILLDPVRSNYAQVEFFLETNDSVSQSSEVYLIGDFNNWMIDFLNKMNYNNETGLWEGDALIKQGEYTYKYVLRREGVIDDLSLDDSFLSSQQEYLTFVYFKDPTHNFDRLLKVSRTTE